MSWIQQEKRRSQGSWVSSMPVQAAHVGYARRAAACPLVGLVGACCSGCAEGKGCSGKEELEHAKAHVGFISVWADWDANVKPLNAEIQKLDVAIRGTPIEKQWAFFYDAWNKWFTADPSDFLGHISGDDYDYFKTSQLAFNNFLGKVAELGYITSASPVDTRHPVEQATDSATKGADDAIASVVSTLTTVAIWGGVGLVLYLAAPFVIARIAKK